jgi:hypothetical protein
MRQGRRLSCTITHRGITLMIVYARCVMDNSIEIRRCIHAIKRKTCVAIVGAIHQYFCIFKQDGYLSSAMDARK